ncbi:MAG: hypothetical protein A2103_03750 [Gammaproteobacteria bacterium GWF2_41_13]|nr:MAG: hypothetical protein A2103_03750 [Gammaproteobacteria bacterium GWF2_41_13]
MTTDFLETLDLEMIAQAVQGKRLNDAYELGKRYYEQNLYRLARKILGLVTRTGQHVEAHNLSMTIQKTMQEDEENTRILDAAINEIQSGGFKQ